MSLSARQMLAVQVSERTMSVLSIFGSLFIISTFLKWHYFRKPINRLVFYASFGNILTNVATLISISAMPGYDAGYQSLCELQGILIQWWDTSKLSGNHAKSHRFMMADTLWVFSMALNVMLVFFRGYNSRQLLRLEKWYMLFSYGCPGVIAITYVIMNHVGPHRGKVIGPAAIWCWVGKDMEWMRLAFFYAPIWVVVCATLCIYIATGHQIFKKRSELRSFSKLPDHELGSTLANPFTAVDLRNIKVETEMKVETTWKETSIDQDSLQAYPPSRHSFSSTKGLAEPRENTAGLPSVPPKSVLRNDNGHQSGYQATAFSTNYAHDSEPKDTRSYSISQPNLIKRRTAAYEGNAAAWGYFKVAFLMFAALFIVWVPSTINRVQQFVDREHSVFGLNLASALVLPLQGFWNSMIYISTTWPECKRALADTLDAYSKFRNSQSGRPWTKQPSISNTHNTHESGGHIPLSPVRSRSESQRHLQSPSSEGSGIRVALPDSSPC